MNKLILKGKAMACLIFVCLFVAQSCKKEVLLPNSKDLQSGLSISDAKRWYLNQKLEKQSSLKPGNNQSSKELQLIWDLATENLAKNDKSVVAIPLNKSSKLNFGKYGFRKLLVSKNDSSAIQGEIMEVIFDEKDVLKKDYKDLYRMSDFNGIVVLYNMQMTFKVGYEYKNGRIDKIIKLDAEKAGANNIFNQPNNPSSFSQQAPNEGINKLAVNKLANLYVTCQSTYIPPNDGYDVPGCDCDGYWVTSCSFQSGAIPWVIDFVADPNPSNNPSNNGNGGIPVVYGFYGALPDPCNVDPNSPVMVICDDGKSAYLNEINLILGLNLTQQQWLLNNFEMQELFRNYFENNGGATQENVQFIQWTADYLIQYPNTKASFNNVFFNGAHNLTFENVQINSATGNFLSASDYHINGLATEFTESEFDNVIQNLSNPITDDPIELYMVASYKNSKLLNSSTYSKPSNFKIGEYSLTPHYNSQNVLVFYSAFRNSSLGIEYLIRADALNSFKEKYSTYKFAADLFYVNGKPSLSQLQMAAGDYWESIVEANAEAFSNPMYYLYLAHVFIGTSTNLKTVPNSTEPLKFTSTTLRNSRKVSITIKNSSIQQYRNAISQKYNLPWEDLGNGSYRLESGQNRYLSYPNATSTGKPTIEYFRNGKSIGKFRFHN